MRGNTTLERQGTKSEPVRTTDEKVWFTVFLLAVANGRKLKPFVMFKGVWIIFELNSIHGVVVALSKNSWMNEMLTIDWVK